MNRKGLTRSNLRNITVKYENNSIDYTNKGSKVL